jgi:glucose/arabinose dehydrogenase
MGFASRSIWVSLLVATLCACGGGGGSSNANSPPQNSQLAFTRTATDLIQPLFVTHAGDGSNRMFVVERGGAIKVLKNGATLATPFLDIASRITTAGSEQGLLGLAFSPAYATNGEFYVNYTRAADGATIVSRYRVSTNADIADPNSEEIILTEPQPFVNHNGGHLAFGPDGYLYIGLGDGGSGGDPGDRAQDLNERLGKLLRIDVECGVPPCAAPASNPFVATAGARAEIWALGLRNPWRFSFDRLTGDLYIGDVGQGGQEEINFQAAASAGGENYGWRILEGEACFDPSSNCTPPTNYSAPIATYTRAASCSSVTGGYVYRGPSDTILDGGYIYADFCDGRVWRLKRNGAIWQNDLLADTDFSVSSFGEDEVGNLYLVDYGTGTTYRVTGK